MATAIGARLARVPGTTVRLCGSWSEGLLALARRGAIVHDAEGTWSAPVATARTEECGPADLVLVLVKSHQTASVASLAARSAGANGTVVTLQNGLGNREILEAASSRPVVAGVTTIGATLLGPGEVRVLAGRVTIGAEPDTDGGRLTVSPRSCAGPASTPHHPGPRAGRVGEAGRELLGQSADRARRLPERRSPRGRGLPRDPERRGPRGGERWRPARGIRLEEEAGEWALRVARDTGANRSSMLQDVERGARTEIDALCGAVCREGRALGVPTPVNRELWRRVRVLEGRPLRAEEEA